MGDTWDPRAELAGREGGGGGPREGKRGGDWNKIYTPKSVKGLHFYLTLLENNTLYNILYKILEDFFSVPSTYPLSSEN